jgi:CelD/BcsL family acetyltransferase involved in cellulose biosynthesis
MWDAALEKSMDNNVFLSWEWLNSWWKNYRDNRKFLLIAVVDGEQLLAAAPMMFTNYNVLGLKIRRVEYLTNPAADYHTFLLTKKEPEAVRLILEHIKNEVKNWDLIELSDMPQDSQTCKTIAGLASNLKLKLRPQDLCPYATLPSSFEEYFQSLSFNLRRNLRKNERRVSKQHKLGFTIYRNVDDVKANMEVFFGLHQKRWRLKSEAGAFADENFRNFHLAVANSFALRGWLVLSFLTFDDVPVSAGYGFAYRNKLYSYLSGFDPQFSDSRVGSLRLMNLIKSCIQDGLYEYDFLRGDESYKEQWSTGVRTNMEYWVARKGIIPAVYGRFTKNDRLLKLVRELGKNDALRQRAG